MITLTTLDTATAQQVFDQVKNHLLKQNARSENESVGCAYKQGDLKCAAGCLISDNEYKSDYEGLSWEWLVVLHNISSNHKNLIRELQLIHDKEDVEGWEDSLRHLAEMFDLEWNNSTSNK